MKVKKYKQAMRPKKYLTHDFIVYRDPSLSQQEARSEMQEGGIVEREGFKYGSFANPVKSEDGTYKVRIGTGEILEFNTKAEVIAEGKRREKLRRENMKKGVAKQEEGRLKIRNDVDDWTREWIEDNINKYEFGQRDKFLNDIKKAWKTKSKDFKATRQLNLSAADYPRVTDNINFDNPFSMYGQDITQTQVKNEKEFFDSLFTRIFYKNKFETDPTLRANGESYLKYINANKRNLTRYKTPDELREIFGTFDDPRIIEIFSKESDLTNRGKSQLFGSVYGDEYKKYQVKKQKMRDNYLNNVDIIKKKTGIDVRKELQKEQQFLKKLFKVDKLPEELRYGGDHIFGISEISKITDKKEMKNAVNNMVGLMHQENFNLGTGVFEAQRGELVRKVNSAKGPAKSAALSELNDLMRSTYSQYFPNQKNFYSLSNNKLIVDPNFKGQTQPQRMANWAYKVSKKDPELIKTTFTDKTVQKAFLDLQKGNSQNMINLIESQFGETLDNETIRILKRAGQEGFLDPRALQGTLKLLTKAGTKGARFAGALLIGATRGEILTTIGLEAAMPFMSYLRGEGGKRMLSESFLADFVAQGLNKAGIIDYDINKLNKDIYAANLEGEELGAATITVNQVGRLETMSSLLQESARLTDEIKKFEEQKSSLPAYKHSTLDQRIKIRQQRIDEINNEIPSLVEAFSDPKNKVTKIGVDALQKAIEQTSEEEAYLGYQRKKPFLDFFESIGLPLTDRSKTLPTTPAAKQTLRNIENVFGITETPVGQKVTEKIGSGAQQRLELQKQLPRETMGFEDYYGGSMVPTGVEELPTNRAEGGMVVKRKGFKDGPKITRRGFIGAVAALIASLKVGSFGGTGKKITTEVGKKVIKNAPDGTPDWFPALVDKVFKEGVDAGETMKTTTTREIVKKLEVPSPNSDGALTDKYFLYENPDTGEIRIEIDAPGLGANDGEFSLYMRPSRVDGINDDGTPIIDEGEFFVSEERAVGRMNGPDDFDIELETIDTDLSNSASDFHKVEEFATGKTNKKAQAEQLKKKDYIERNPAEDIENRYGPFNDTPPDDDY